eukprot:7325412-Lingulodinium_polyedra.AAC.1
MLRKEKRSQSAAQRSVWEEELGAAWRERSLVHCHRLCHKISGRGGGVRRGQYGVVLSDKPCRSAWEE